MILVDDLGWGDVGYHGSEIRTPRIDALAARGVRSERFYVLPTCSATRAALLTGRHPVRYGLQTDVIRPWASHGLDPIESTLADDLRRAGYVTSLVGKWHLGLAREEYLPTRRGFDRHYGFYGGMIDHVTHRRQGGLDWHRDGAPVEETGHATDLLADDAVRQLRRHDPEAPLFLVLSFSAPHNPLQAPREDVQAYAHVTDPARRKYAAMVTHLDRAIGRVVDALDETGLTERTLVVFLSDNGALRPPGSNRPLRGGKGTLWEGGVRVPAFFVWPPVLAAGSRIETPIHVVDLRATLAAAAGVRPGSDVLDGRDVLPVLRGVASSAEPREILLNLEAGRSALLVGRWKLRVTGPLQSPSEIALFDVLDDPAEEQDRSAGEPERVQALLSRLRSRREMAVPALFQGKRPPPGFRAPSVWGPPAP